MAISTQFMMLLTILLRARPQELLGSLLVISFLIGLINIGNSFLVMPKSTLSQISEMLIKHRLMRYIKQSVQASIRIPFTSLLRNME